MVVKAEAGTDAEVAADPAKETQRDESTGEAAEGEVLIPEGEQEETGAETETENADAIRKDEIKGLTEEAQTAVNRRIGKVVAREKAAIERADAAESELEAAKGKLDGGFPDMVKRLGLHGDLVNKDEAQTLEQYGKLKAQRAWCRRHEQDGYEGTGGDDPNVDAKTIRSRLVEIEEQLDEIGSSAKEIQGRVEKQAREIWAAGRAALKAKDAGGRGPGDGNRKTEKTLVKPPRIPSGTGTPKAPAAAKKSKGTFDPTEFKKDGGGKAALEKQMEKLYG